MDYIESARNVFNTEISALKAMRDALDSTFSDILKELTVCKGKVVITAIGKPGHIAKKVSATLSSLGTPSIYLHPAEAMHGDLGILTSDDVVIAMSYSGESDEIIAILPVIKMIGCKLIALTGNRNSTLASAADIVQVFPKFEEACHMNLAPTSSTTVELCYCDALAIVASEVYGYTKEDFGRIHPAGSLGKKLILKVDDLMAKKGEIAKIKTKSLLMAAITEMTKKKLGIVSVVDPNDYVLGVLTDGDLRRAIEKKMDIYNVIVDDMMTKNPYTITKGKLAIEALNFLKDKSINSLPVVDNNKLIGTITWQMIVKAGIVL